MPLLLKDGLLDKLLEFDTWLLLKINNSWTNPVFDTVFPFWRQSQTWIPLYFFLFIFITLNFGKRSWWWILALLLTASLADQISSNFIKEAIGRIRPCRNPDLASQIRFFVTYCPGSGSFTSSHAVNHWATAIFITSTLNQFFGKWKWLFIAWAAVVCYAQVYVGVHYPTDVIGGAVLGSLIGYGMSFIYKSQKRIGLKME
jgi:undecaprenyl-diphosphatase